MMGDEQEKSAKIFFLLNSVLESKAKYIEVSKDGNVLFKVKLVVDDKDFIHILDSFFDDGLSVKKIEKENFDSFNGVETLEFNF